MKRGEWLSAASPGVSGEGGMPLPETQKASQGVETAPSAGHHLRAIRAGPRHVCAVGHGSDRSALLLDLTDEREEALRELPLIQHKFSETGWQTKG